LHADFGPQVAQFVCHYGKGQREYVASCGLRDPCPIGEARRLSGFYGVNIGPQFMPRDGIFDGLLDGYDVLSGQFGIAVEPVPDVLLLDGFGHDDRETPRKLGLSARCLYCPFDRPEFCHGAESTQPPLFLQQPALLGALQQRLYIKGMTYGKRLQAAMDHAEINQRELAERVKNKLSAHGVKTSISQQTVARALKSGKSEYTLWFAIACGVNPEWLDREIGDKTGNKSGPFLDEDRWLHVSAIERRRIERLVLRMIEDFEADNGGLPAKKSKPSGERPPGERRIAR
jgi:hypothetical protein